MWRITLIGAIGCFAIACSPTTEQPAECIQGESRSCVCDDGEPGALVCGESGFFAPCARNGTVCIATATTSQMDASAGSDTGDAEPDGTAVDTTPPPGPAVACPFPGLEAIATLIEGPGVDTYPVAFYADGALRSVAGTECEYLGDDSSPDRCIDEYTCGGCELRLFGDPDSVVLTSGSPQDACDQLGIGGAYSVEQCTRSCDGRSCGDDGLRWLVRRMPRQSGVRHGDRQVLRGPMYRVHSRVSRRTRGQLLHVWGQLLLRQRLCVDVPTLTEPPVLRGAALGRRAFPGQVRLCGAAGRPGQTGGDVQRSPSSRPEIVGVDELHAVAEAVVEVRATHAFDAIVRARVDTGGVQCGTGCGEVCHPKRQMPLALGHERVEHAEVQVNAGAGEPEPAIRAQRCGFWDLDEPEHVAIEPPRCGFRTARHDGLDVVESQQVDRVVAHRTPLKDV